MRSGSAMMPTLSSSARSVTIARSLVELLLEDDDVALDLVAGRLDDVEALVEDQLLARACSVSALIAGWRFTFTLRPCDRMLTVPSSFAER